MALPPVTSEEPLTLEATPKRVRAMKEGRIIADSNRAQLVRRAFPPPRTYAFPPEDLIGNPPEDSIEVDGHVVIQWESADRWYEESEEVFVHPKDPHSRIEALHTKRHIQVELEGKLLADTTRSVMLIEAHPYLPIRFYIPHDDVSLARLRPSDTVTQCPYKGHATYYDVEGSKDWKRDLAWEYRTPLREVEPVRGRICFYNEHVDITIDGEAVPRPKTPWS